MITKLTITLISLLGILSIKQSHPNVKYYVTFYAYSAELIDDQTPGHVIIAFGKEDSNKNMSISDGAWGFYPNMSSKVANLFYDGEVKTGLVKSDINKIFTKQLVEVRISKEVSATEYKNAYALITQWDNNEDYHLLNHNCVHFAQTIAKAINMKVSNNVDSTSPETFMEDLVKQNQ